MNTPISPRKPVIRKRVVLIAWWLNKTSQLSALRSFIDVSFTTSVYQVNDCQTLMYFWIFFLSIMICIFRTSAICYNLCPAGAPFINTV